MPLPITGQRVSCDPVGQAQHSEDARVKCAVLSKHGGPSSEGVLSHETAAEGLQASASMGDEAEL